MMFFVVPKTFFPIFEPVTLMELGNQPKFAGNSLGNTRKLTRISRELKTNKQGTNKTRNKQLKITTTMENTLGDKAKGMLDEKIQEGIMVQSVAIPISRLNNQNNNIGDWFDKLPESRDYNPITAYKTADRVTSVDTTVKIFT